MTQPLKIAPKEDTPEIFFSKENNRFEISGRSMPENVTVFFDPVFQWLTDYFEEPLDETHFMVNLDYFNSASAKKLVELLIFLEGQHQNGNKVSVSWHFTKNDFTMQKKGQELLGSFNLPYTIIPV